MTLSGGGFTQRPMPANFDFHQYLFDREYHAQWQARFEWEDAFERGLSADWRPELPPSLYFDSLKSEGEDS